MLQETFAQSPGTFDGTDLVFGDERFNLRAIVESVGRVETVAAGHVIRELSRRALNE